MQRSAFYVILGQKYESYSNALQVLKSETLEERRVKLCKNFAKKSAKHPRYKNWFCESTETEQSKKTRKKNWEIKSKYNHVQYRTDRFKNSHLSYLTELLNNMD